MARKQTRIEPGARVIVAGLVALALLALGEQAPAAWPVHVTLEGHGTMLGVSVDGQTHVLSSQLGGGWQRVRLEQPGPLEREYQIDGSDTTSTRDRDHAFIMGLLASPLYALDAFLRDESSYSRWEHLSITDLQSNVSVSPDGPLPNDFRLEVDLRRPEAAAEVWLVGPTPDRREGLQVERDTRNARWVFVRGNGLEALPRWFFPEQPLPFAAELLHMVGRTAAAGFVLLVLGVVLGRLVARIRVAGKPPTSPVYAGLLLAWLLASAFVTVRLYHQLPHVLDAISYTFQAGVFASGQLAQAAPPVPDAFKGPFEVLWQGRIFSQYPPGAAAFYAIAGLFSVEWLVGPLACLGLIGATAWSAKTLFGPATGLVTLVLGVLSPFVLFQSGSYLSHPIAGGLMAGALAAFVAAECRGDKRWYAVTGLFLGAGFLAREAASVLFALPLVARLVLTRRRGALGSIVLFGLPFLLMYLLYNLSQTGSPLLLPRTLFDATDHFGFGDGIGFHTRHTLAAGLANTDELLTIAQFDLFGWTPLFAFGLMSLPFLLGRATAWDWMAAGGFLAFVVAYVGYFYHGIALGPRYYFEAMPWLLLLAARGAQVLAEVARTWLAPGMILALLSLNTLLFYLPVEIARRADLSGMPGVAKLSLPFVEPSLTGPRLEELPGQSLVLTKDWWLYNAALAALNCPRAPDCDVLFALATSDADAQRLRGQYPERTLLRAVNDNGVVQLAPY